MFLNLYSLKCLTKQKQNMKKSVLALAMAFGVTGAFAQDLTSKKGEPFLPEAGDWSIGIDASPLFDYAKSMIGAGAGATSPSFNFLTGNNVIIGKMYKDEKTAYRAAIRLNSTSNKYSHAITDAAQLSATASTSTAAFQTSSEPKVDKASVATRNIALSAGMEMRRGKTRLQGFYGGEFGIWGGSTKEKYSYANDLMQNTDATKQFDADNSTYSTDWSAINDANGNPIGTNVVADLGNYGYLASTTDAARVLKRKSAGNIGVGVRAFIGAEYFIFPKISIGGEFGWGIGYQINTKNKTTLDAEGTDSGSGTQTAQEVKHKDNTNRGSSFVIDTDNKNSLVGASASLRLNLHF